MTKDNKFLEAFQDGHTERSPRGARLPCTCQVLALFYENNPNSSTRGLPDRQLGEAPSEPSLPATNSAPVPLSSDSA